MVIDLVIGSMFLTLASKTSNKSPRASTAVFELPNPTNVQKGTEFKTPKLYCRVEC